MSEAGADGAANAPEHQEHSEYKSEPIAPGPSDGTVRVSFGESSEDWQPSASPQVKHGATRGLTGISGVSNITLTFHEDMLEDKAGRNKEFYWIKVQAGRENEHIDAEEVIDQHGIPEHIFLQKIREEKTEEEAVKTLPFALILVILYALVNFAHSAQAVIQSVEQAIDFDITENGNFAFSIGEGGTEYMGHKNYEDVNSYADFWSWMNKGMCALYFPEDYAVSEGAGFSLGALPAAKRNSYLWHNRKVGPMRIRKEDLRPADCVNDEMSSVYGLSCFEDGSFDLTLDPTDFDVSHLAFQEENSDVQWLEADDYAATLAELETTRWLNNRTQRIEVSFLSYNAEQDVFCRVSIHFLFSRSGHIWKQVTHKSAVLDPYKYWETYLWDILFYCHISALFLNELYEIFTTLRRVKWSCKVFFSTYFGFWNFVDWVSIIMAYIQLVVWFVRFSHLKTLEDDVRAYSSAVGTCPVGADGDVCRQTFYQVLFEHTNTVGYWSKQQNLLGAFYPVSIVLRLFKTFQAQPRLALVSRTLYNSSTDLFHFGVVFLSAFFSFVLVGIALFGREMTEFAQFDRALMTLVRAFFGDFDHTEMANVDRASAFCYLLSFQTTMFLIMLNMLIAIVMDIYAETKGSLSKGETLWDEGFEIAQRFYRSRMGLRMTFDEITSKFIAARGEKAAKSKLLITMSDLLETIPDLTSSQARRLMKGAAQDWGDEHNVPVELREVLSVASRAAELAQQVSNKLKTGPGSSAYRHSATTGLMHLSRSASELGKPISLKPAPTAAQIVEARDITLEDIFAAAKLRSDLDYSRRLKDDEEADSIALARLLDSLSILGTGSEQSGRRADTRGKDAGASVVV